MYRPDQFICGGYFLVKRIARPPDISDSLPATIVTLSDCFTEVAPDMWAISWYNYDDSERAAEAAKFGIPAAAVPQLLKLLSGEIGGQHRKAFPSLAVGRAFYRECANKNEVALLGIGLDPSFMASLRDQKGDDVNRGYGLLERVELQRPLDPAGEPLGFEPLGFEATKFHSWLCHDGPLEASQKLGVQTNNSGFIDSLSDAVKVTQYLKNTGAEPGIWEPWLVVKYT